jgi:hypothetical protein
MFSTYDDPGAYAVAMLAKASEVAAKRIFRINIRNGSKMKKEYNE